MENTKSKNNGRNFLGWLEKIFFAIELTVHRFFMAPFRLPPRGIRGIKKSRLIEPAALDGPPCNQSPGALFSVS